MVVVVVAPSSDENAIVRCPVGWRVEVRSIHQLDDGIPQLFCTTNSRRTMRVSDRNPFYVELLEFPLEAIRGAPFVGVPC